MTDARRLEELEAVVRTLTARVRQLEADRDAARNTAGKLQMELERLYTMPPYVLAAGGAIALLGALIGGQ